MNEQKRGIAVLGGGCFWCTEAVFTMLKGVSKVEPGYSGGTTLNPTYEQVSTGNTGHAEVIHLEYDPSVVAYRQRRRVTPGPGIPKISSPRRIV